MGIGGLYHLSGKTSPECQARIPVRGHPCHASPSQQFRNYIAIARKSAREKIYIVDTIYQRPSSTLLLCSCISSLEREPMQELTFPVSYLTPLTPQTPHNQTVMRNNGFISATQERCSMLYCAIKLRHQTNWALVVCLPETNAVAANDYLVRLWNSELFTQVSPTPT